MTLFRTFHGYIVLIVIQLHSSLLFYILELMEPFTMGRYCNGAYIKYVGRGEGRMVLEIFQKIFCSPGDHRPKYIPSSKSCNLLVQTIIEKMESNR